MDDDNNPANGVVQNTQHEVIGTVGECRERHDLVVDEDRDHFHNGIDIPGYNGTRIYAVESGTAHVRGSGVNIGHIRYYHLRDIEINDMDFIAVGDLIGYTDNLNHLHFMDSELLLTQQGEPNVPWLNPLSLDGLAPFIDSASPVIDAVELCRNDTLDVISTNIYGKIDIKVNAYDPRTDQNGGNGGGRCGVYEICIKFYKDSQVLDSILYHRYDVVPRCYVKSIFAEGSNNTNFLYWATNDPFQLPTDKYWNTKQRRGCNYSTDARINAEALLGDGKIRIEIIALDIKGNQSVYTIGK